MIIIDVFMEIIFALYTSLGLGEKDPKENNKGE